ncbi:diaminohydroxyphosphoribosylaminopyrimidine deaminase / 5-amino-6-(5-phosphoribosylamino)uracil reductase [Candidatus Protochlamydia naegleriophila]|uniref:Riboflavin biosynthesis protein RibD n=2 Tax=Candidatus Protochlamydia naegleriophila TaxID=389348 RepID=A0A0U5J8S7_9BACT|nr:diaminohydroxyphosphoribosylaminopyrimidine deaminase / 5-amino-6-(5-phosphoribosylamino)uracil reductase [Candidatus Protochlamydia naegleriophila]
MHTIFMQQALVLAEKARFQAPPNPWVGCVIVKDQQIIGQGYTSLPGQAHAEVKALHEAGEKAQDAALYVTLEPCSHFGRTPPCVEAIIRAGIKQVYIAQEDPDPRVQGKGIQRLQEAGIQVFTGLCEEEARLSLTPYLYQRRTRLPYTVIKIAASADGRTAAADGTSQWITSPEARLDGHFQRAQSQAIIVGAGTALIDTPNLTVRHPLVHLPQQPLRVILDGNGRVPAEGPLFDLSLAQTLVLTSHSSSIRQKEWENRGAEVVLISADRDGRLDLKDAWNLLGSRGILQVLIEGGSTLQTNLFKTQLVNRLSLYLGALLLGSQGLPLFSEKIATLKQAYPLSLKSIKQLGDSVRIDYDTLHQ